MQKDRPWLLAFPSAQRYLLASGRRQKYDGTLLGSNDNNRKRERKEESAKKLISLCRSALSHFCNPICHPLVVWVKTSDNSGGPSINADDLTQKTMKLQSDCLLTLRAWISQTAQN
ncbi:hypothetical protein CEXT_466291 [Caerostris extrusa]|uniref:Uncharacterized protein n=1 Tax=Caerostris extrusa TaxID=172846 RepID=A0AAV4WSF9_CAEEX|nr:hypothetical protein CEXT_466291 [Caerostris extrusa]